MRKQLVPMIILAIAFTACSGSDASSTAVAPAEAEDPATVVAEPTTTTAALADSDSPVEAMLGVPVFDSDAMDEWFRELDIDRRRLTAECMLREGFEFSIENAFASQVDATEFPRDSRGYAATYGFGIASAFAAAEYDPELDYSTPNSRYLASLTPGEAAAYQLALVGSPTDETDVFDGSDAGGCTGAAFREVFAVLGVMNELSPLLEDYYVKFRADSRVLALNAIWQDCMAEAGYVYENADEMRASFYPRLGEIVNEPTAYVDVEMPDDLGEQDMSFVDEEFGLHPALTPAAQSAFDVYAESEIMTATTHWDCFEVIREDELSIQREYEALFADEARPLIGG